ncbi:uncharacterized protein LOC143292600 [Babylonia areolata]|uniref:uncharacterized protein LOC143292600 n=1 Tax=Babylonia areolata TaxID=304850 RepID=UPI003FD5B543
MSHTNVKVTMDPSSKPHFGHHLMDFANMLKAFIGSNYLAIAFAFRQSGIALGCFGLVFIASLTAHCCRLLVSCKYHAIRHLLTSMERHRSSNMQLQGEKTHRDLSNSDDSLSLSNSDDGSSDESGDDQDAVHKKLLQNLNFGDIGRLCMGRAGLTLVNTAVMITQFGFCVGYCIFVGNTIHSMFPLYNCSVFVGSSNVSGVVQQCFEVKHLNSLNSVHVDMNDMVETPPGVLHNRRSLPLLGSESSLSNNTTVATTPAAVSGFMSFLASDSSINVLHSTTPVNSNNTIAFQNVSSTTESPAAFVSHNEKNMSDTTDSGVTPVTPNVTSAEKMTSTVTSVMPNITVSENLTSSVTVIPNIGTTENLLSPVISGSNTTLVDGAVTKSTVPVNMTRWTLFRGKHVPGLKLLVVLPVIVFVPMTLIRNLRHLGFISVFANAAIFLGCIEVLLFLVSGFAVSNTFVWANWQDLPIFFGMVTSAFEGIGTILPIESSMEGNRHNFISFLYGAVAVLTLVLGCFGVMGYLNFGEGVEQMINANIPTSHWLGLAVNACLCIGVVLTFPLMMYPVVEMAEVYLFGDGRICGPGSERVKTKDYQSLLPKKQNKFALPVAEKVSDSVATWKRNVLRILVVLCAGSLAILLRNYFAYISAFVGALGSTMLAYILPCLFHLKLCWPQLSLYNKVKDITIIIIGVCCGAAGVYAVLLEIFSSLKA